MIEQLAITFEMCLFQVVSYDPAMVLHDIITTFAKDVSTACQEVLIKIGMGMPDIDSIAVWRCAVHILDLAALSYAGAHTQSIGKETVTSVSLPGLFLATQYFRFCRRTFSCLSKFLGGQKVWVLELYNAGTHFDLPPLCLSTNAMTFGDIWGPMWKSCALGHEDQIIQYSVGNGVIIPWNRPASTSRDSIEIQKSEVFCHWLSDNERCDHESLSNSLTLHENDTILIGAPVVLVANGACKVSTARHRQRLRNSGSITEHGTKKPSRMLDSETVQLQVTPPSMGLAYQRQYKRRGRSLKDCLIETWKNSPSSRHVRYLEFKLGLEVSACTHNARRITLIELFGTKTMLNHLQNVSLQWSSSQCRDRFYTALQSTDHTKFSELYKANPDWQTDLGNAVGCCFDALADTGKSEDDLVLFWAPGAEPGETVTLKSKELSWIGFLEDTETSGTLAVLEEKCLELPNPGIGRKCLSNHFDSRHIDGGLDSKHSGGGLSIGTLHGSILETSVYLNQSCVPTSIRDGHIKSRRHDGERSRYLYRWSLRSLKEGDKFEFGEKGTLKAITPLAQGQILAKWSSSLHIKHQLKTISSKIPVLGRVVDEPPANIHDESIRVRKEDTSPICFIILSTAKGVLQSAQNSRRSSLLCPQKRPYEYDPSETGVPRSLAKSARSVTSPNELRDILDMWDMRGQDTSEISRQEWEQ